MLDREQPRGSTSVQPRSAQAAVIPIQVSWLLSPWSCSCSLLPTDGVNSSPSKAASDPPCRPSGDWGVRGYQPRTAIRLGEARDDQPADTRYRSRKGEASPPPYRPSRVHPRAHWWQPLGRTEPFRCLPSGSNSVGRVSASQAGHWAGGLALRDTGTTQRLLPLPLNQPALCRLNASTYVDGSPRGNQANPILASYRGPRLDFRAQPA